MLQQSTTSVRCTHVLRVVAWGVGAQLLELPGLLPELPDLLPGLLPGLLELPVLHPLALLLQWAA